MATNIDYTKYTLPVTPTPTYGVPEGSVHESHAAETPPEPCGSDCNCKPEVTTTMGTYTWHPPRQDWASLAMGHSGDVEIEEAFLRVLQEMYETFCRKQRDYGRGNIAKFGESGVMIRLNDKVERLVNLWKKQQMPENESTDDTWVDVATYGAIGLMCSRGQWPK